MKRPPTLVTTGLALLGALALAACHNDDVPSRVADAPGATDQAAPAATTAPARGERLPSADEALVPRRTRAGTLRFTSPAIEGNTALAPEILARFAREPSAELRAALVDALPRTGGDWFDGAYGALAHEPEAAVRRAIVAIMPRAEATQALRGIMAGLADAEPSVRAEAALSAGSLPEAARGDGGLRTRLGQLLSDTDGSVRAGAARTLGLMAHAPAFEPIARLLGDADAEVRLQAVHALERIDRERAARLPALGALRSDPDPKVAHAARILAP
jgi:HEAT repeat protein